MEWVKQAPLFSEEDNYRKWKSRVCAWLNLPGVVKMGEEEVCRQLVSAIKNTAAKRQVLRNADELEWSGDIFNILEEVSSSTNEEVVVKERESKSGRIPVYTVPETVVQSAGDKQWVIPEERTLRKDRPDEAGFKQRKPFSCSKCRKDWHTAKTCWADKICHWCHKIGHIQAVCFRRKSGPSRITQKTGYRKWSQGRGYNKGRNRSYEEDRRSQRVHQEQWTGRSSGCQKVLYGKQFPAGERGWLDGVAPKPDKQMEVQHIHVEFVMEWISRSVWKTSEETQNGSKIGEKATTVIEEVDEPTDRADSRYQDGSEDEIQSEKESDKMCWWSEFTDQEVANLRSLGRAICTCKSQLNMDPLTTWRQCEFG